MTRVPPIPRRGDDVEVHRRDIDGRTHARQSGRSVRRAYRRGRHENREEQGDDVSRPKSDVHA
jgi:hypothetical protein